MNRCNYAFTLVGILFSTSSVNEWNLEEQKILNCVRVLEINNEFSWLLSVVHLTIIGRRYHGVPAEERLHWRSFLVKLGADNLKGAKNEELLVASHKYVNFSSSF